MAVFSWSAKAKTGEVRQGEMAGENAAQVISALRGQGYRTVRTRKKSEALSLFSRNTVSEMEIVVFTRQMATMVSAGLPLVQCFDLAAKGSANPTLRSTLNRIKSAVESGTALNEAMAREHKVFDELFIHLVQAGEQSGILDTVLARIAIYKEKTAALKGKIRSAMIYPIAVLVVACAITALLMVFVVPSFAELFSSFGAALPLPTRVVIALSEWTQRYGWLVLLGAAALGYALAYFYRNHPMMREKMDALLLRLPIFGMILRKATVARFARTFGTMLAAGTPILECLESVARTAGNRVVEKTIRHSRSAISEGKPLAGPLSLSGVFPVMVTQMISVGESTGNLDLMLEKIADFYESEVDRAVEGLTALLEPLILVFLGTVIGGLVIAMYLPIFRMGHVVG